MLICCVRLLPAIVWCLDIFHLLLTQVTLSRFVNQYQLLQLNLLRRMLFLYVLPQIPFDHETNVATATLVDDAQNWLNSSKLFDTTVTQDQAGTFRKLFETNYALGLVIQFVRPTEMVL